MSTFVLVHGAWGSGKFWRLVAPALDRLGHSVAIVDQLPSAGTDPSALRDMAADVVHVEEVAGRLGDGLVLVGHSYSGMILTELAAHPSVAHSVYVSAFMTGPGQSMLDLVGAGPPPRWWFPRDDGAAQITDDVALASATLWQDLDEDAAAEAHADLQLQALSVFGTPSSARARAHPTTYVVCQRDRAIPPELQEAMAQRADRVVRIDASHCPQLGAAEQLAAVMDGAVTEAALSVR